MTEDWRAAHAQTECNLAERVRSLCAAKPSLIGMATAVARDIVVPDVRRLVQNDLARPIRVQGLDLPVVRAWNSLMPDHTPPAGGLDADEECLGTESAFAQLLSEAAALHDPEVGKAAEEADIAGFGDDADMRARAAGVLAEVTIALSFRGKLPPVMCEATKCSATGEYVHFALWGWQPENTDQNEVVIPHRNGDEPETDGFSM